MSKVYIPENYRPVLDAYDTQRAIAYIKTSFQQEFAAALNLKRVSAPLFVAVDSGLNDDLNGYERAVSFDIPAVGADAQVVHSLAKWKRLALKRYSFTIGNGLYTDMNAIRRDEELDNIHSIYVDQWDWEKIITRENRDLDYLKLHLAEGIQLEEGPLNLYLILSLLVVFGLTMAVCYGLKQCRNILAPMKEGRPFAENVPACLKKLALTVLIGGAVMELCGIAERMILAHACSVEQLFHPDRVVLVEEAYTVDFSFILVFCIIQFLSYIFTYGQELQKESDETL